MRKWRTRFMTLFIKAPEWLSCRTSFAQEEILHVTRLWRDFKSDLRTKGTPQRSTSSSYLLSTDETDLHTTMSTTPARIVSPTAAAPCLETRISSRLEDELFANQSFQRRTCYGSSIITVRRDGKFVTLASRALNGSTLLTLEIVPTDQAFLKDSWKHANLKARIYLQGDDRLVEILEDLKQEILQTMVIQQDLIKTSG